MQPLLDAVVSGFNGSETAVDDVSSCSYTNEVIYNCTSVSVSGANSSGTPLISGTPIISCI